MISCCSRMRSHYFAAPKVAGKALIALIANGAPKAWHARPIGNPGKINTFSISTPPTGWQAGMWGGREDGQCKTYGLCLTLWCSVGFGTTVLGIQG